jgi:hypothetical protein
MHSRTQRYSELVFRLDSVGYQKRYGRAAIASKLSNALKKRWFVLKDVENAIIHRSMNPCRFPCTAHRSLDEDTVRGDDRLEDRFPRFGGIIGRFGHWDGHLPTAIFSQGSYGIEGRGRGKVPSPFCVMFRSWSGERPVCAENAR